MGLVAFIINIIFTDTIYINTRTNNSIIQFSLLVGLLTQLAEYKDLNIRVSSKIVKKIVCIIYKTVL